MSEICPVFPLSTVLFPGGVLPLRIFEPRYLTMISECMRSGGEFAVALITKGSEAGQPAEFHQRATLARIVDFDRLDDGMLGVTCTGTSMIEIGEHHLQPDNLIRARYTPVQDEPELSFDDQFERLREFLRQILNREEMREYRQYFQEDWDSMVWISHRLSEFLPVSASSRQSLLECDTFERMERLQLIFSNSKLIA
ncbi:MAG: LON peptidase substrate-binding domain-containing protein [Pseudomonadota bacterium]